jgi:hypothetical protein
MSDKIDIRKDWTHAFLCGCKVTWLGASFHKSRRMTCCEQHNGRAAIDMRNRLQGEAKGYYDLAFAGKPMPPYADIHRLKEDDRIAMIGTAAMRGGVIAFLTDSDPGKVERYIAKLLAKFPELTVIDQTDGPVANVVTVRVTRKVVA